MELNNVPTNLLEKELSKRVDKTNNMEKVKKIPIQTAKDIAALGYDEVIIVGCNYETGTQHVTTYGRSMKACENAALGGNAVKRLLKWPERNV